MSRGLGVQQRIVLKAIRALEAAHGSDRWFFVHAVVRAAWPGEVGDVPPSWGTLRPAHAEAEMNPSRILATLARRGLIDRNPKRGLGASIRLTAAGRAL